MLLAFYKIVHKLNIYDWYIKLMIETAENLQLLPDISGLK